jgi:hypothetical protein
MALESLPKIAPALFSAEQDLIEIYNKKSDTRGTINPSYIKSSPSGVSGAIQFSDGSAFSSDASNLYWDNVNKRLGVGTNSPTATGHFKGSGSTSATTSFLVQDSAGNVSFRIKDDGSWSNGGNGNMVLNFGQYWVIGGSTSQLGNLISGQGMSYTSSQPFCINVASGAHQASASFQIDSTTKGFLMPRMTTAEINAIASPANGLEVYNTTLACPCFYDGIAWRKVSHTTM